MSPVQDEHERLASPLAAPQGPSPPADHAAVVQASPMATTTFPTWDAFSVYMAEYQRRTYQVYISKSSTSVATRNRRIVGPKVKNTYLESHFGDRLIPAELKFYCKTLICTHGGKPRSRSQGIRPKQKFRPIECPARVSVLVQKKLGGDNSKATEWHVVVTQHTATHNHPLDAETYMSYPQNRKVRDPMVLEAVDALRKAGVKQREIRKYIAEKQPAKHMTRSDVNNLLMKLKVGSNVPTNGPSSGPSTPSPVAQGGSTRAEATNAELDGPADTEGTREPPVAGGSGGGRGLQTAEHKDGMVNATNSLRGLCESSQMASGGFKLRVERLEEQNLALYAQNMKLIVQNRQYVADLNQARKMTAELDARVVALRQSEAALKEILGRLSQETARLREENDRLRVHNRHQSVILPGMPVPESANHRLGIRGSLEREHVSKRAFDTRGSGNFECARPHKRATGHSSDRSNT